MADFVKVATVADIPVGQSKLVEVDHRAIAVFNCDGTFYAIDNLCKHKGGPLVEGELDGTTVTCPWHGWAYDVTSGQCLEDDESHVDRFAVRIDGDDVLVSV